MENLNIDSLLGKEYLSSVMAKGGIDQVVGRKQGNIYIGYDSYLKGEFFYIIETDESILIMYQGKNTNFKYELLKNKEEILKNGEQINPSNGVIVFKRILKEFAENNSKTITINIKGE